MIVADLRSLIAYLMKLASEEFYGEITVRFRAGKVHGTVRVLQEHLPESLPAPDVASPEYQAVLRSTVAGVL